MKYNIIQSHANENGKTIRMLHRSCIEKKGTRTTNEKLNITIKVVISYFHSFFDIDSLNNILLLLLCKSSINLNILFHILS